MKMITPTLPLAGALAMFAAMAGCTQESTPGGPGVSNRPAQTTTTSSTVKSDSNGTSREEVATTREVKKPIVADKADTFTLHAPKMETTLNTGKKRDVDISISRGSQFKQSVKLEFKAPAGVTVTPPTATIPAGENKVTVTLEATSSASAGKAQVEVMAVPETGKSVSLEMPVEVKHAT
ncbi:MAG TPA: hypothetical protein VFG04_06395 [Planctomycetaceae bacterium]|jgi:uncharacterized membrane protein|nr:hypothetical protein [Planctomycetaceae bacterium]